MPSNKRFRIGNMTVNLGKIDDALKYKPDPNCQLTYGCNQVTVLCNQFTWGGGGCNRVSIICPRFTNIGCGLSDNPCGVNYSTLPPTNILDGWPQPVFIHDLKESLIAQLREVEAYELELKAQETPQTLEEMNELENELQNSLKELQEIKKNLKG